LHHETYVDKTWGWNNDWQGARFHATLDPLLLQIIEKDSQPIGSICVRRVVDEIFLAAIEIAPEYQNRGIATQLIGELLDESARRQVPMRLRVLKVNPARRLYERLGFRCVEETATHYMVKREFGGGGLTDTGVGLS
jgi:ribosomal protein S18 acetylase RimI-like enzyme